MKLSLTAVFAVVLMTMFSASEAQAASFRTFVSSTGSSLNTAMNCPRTAPCRNFSDAYSVTTPGGEIVALDSAGYGSVNITKSVTITAIPGECGFVNVVAGGSGITINAGSSDLVILRNLMIGGAGNANTVGVQHNSGNLIIQNSTFTQLTTGVSATGAKLDLIDSNLLSNTVAVRADGEGADTQSFPLVAATTMIRISGGNIANNGTAFVMANPGQRPNPATDNKINIFVRLLGNSAADWSVNLTGNAAVTSGSGTGCSDPYTCQSIGVYGSTTNPR
ncbi:MAG: hypothetical protein ACRD9R_04175 [Pyrinomonadaceae bacterium]